MLTAVTGGNLRATLLRLCAALAAVILLTGCVSGGDPSNSAEDGGAPEADSQETQEDAQREPLATSVGSSTDLGPDLRFDVYALERIPDGQIRLEFSVTNSSDQEYRLFHGISMREPAKARSVTLIDTHNMRRHHPFLTTEDACFCSNWDGAVRMAPEDTIDIWVVYPEPPPEVEEMTIDIPLVPPLLDVPISEGEAGEAPPGILDEPRILDLLSFVDDVSGDADRTESGDEVGIRLSTDVLFDVNESILTSAADDILEEVAAELDDASGTTVSIDGHADSTGTDAINDPLSQDRAESVQDRLEELVTRSGISFEAEGHGSRDPIADNGTEDGREKNRRVTVAFER